MRAPMERDEHAGRYVSLEGFEPIVVARDVEFSHDPQAEPALKGVTFAINPGDRVALLGRIGSGKSTMLRILMSLYPATRGTITLGGIELRQIDPTEWRKRVGYVPQEPWLLYGTLRSNLTSGCSGVSDEAIW